MERGEGKEVKTMHGLSFNSVLIQCPSEFEQQQITLTMGPGGSAPQP